MTQLGVMDIDFVLTFGRSVFCGTFDESSLAQLCPLAPMERPQGEDYSRGEERGRRSRWRRNVQTLSREIAKAVVDAVWCGVPNQRMNNVASFAHSTLQSELSTGAHITMSVAMRSVSSPPASSLELHLYFFCQVACPWVWKLDRWRKGPCYTNECEWS